MELLSRTDHNARRDSWFDRCAGDWRSDRRYLYFGASEPKVVNLVTHFSVERTEGGHRVTWTGQTNGVMNLTIDGDKLRRDIGYFTDEATTSLMQVLDEDTIVFRTSYGGADYREEIRFLSDDLRLRQTVGMKGDRLVLSGQYTETRSQS
jgi:hypothetical protein